jgi:hypothetical protein
MSISVPTGFCFPKGYLPQFFTVNINVCTRLKIQQTYETDIVDGCDSKNNKHAGPTPAAPTSRNGGCTSFQLKFNLFGGNSYQCANQGDYQDKIQRLIDDTNEKSADINGKNPIVETSERLCTKTTQTGTCPDGTPIYKSETGKITTTRTTKTTATPYISQVSYTSSTGTCRTNPI